MKLLKVLIVWLPFVSIAQSKGVLFQNGFTWEQINKTAKAQNKYVFVDCYATWCKPCKEMDQKVYVNDTVGSFVNQNFISVKVQMDTAKNDDSAIQLLYPTARELEKKYNVIGLPTFLFFSPDGNLVHKEMGSLSVKEFLQLSKNATDPNTQLFTRFENAKSGTLSFNLMPRLIQQLIDLTEDSLAEIVKKIYVNNYLEKLSNENFYAKRTLEKYQEYLSIVSCKSKVFKVYFNESARVDELMGVKGYASDMVNYLIRKEYILPEIKEADEKKTSPNWKTIQKKIKLDYGKWYADYNILNAKIDWSANRKEWNGYITLVLEKWKSFNAEFKRMGSLGLNDVAWNTFLHGNNKKELSTALEWSTIAVETGGNNAIAQLDTKANLLYKLGRQQDAIDIEEKIIGILKKELEEKPDNAKFWSSMIKSYQAMVDKMKSGEPIKFKGQE
jgi:thioredoxin-related protein